jgi:predicted RNA-binding protein Jag
MSELKRRFFSGDSLQQALVQAANHFHLAPEQISYRSIEKKHGFLKSRRKVVIEVDPEAPVRTAPPPAPPPPPRPAVREEVRPPATPSAEAGEALPPPLDGPLNEALPQRSEERSAERSRDRGPGGRRDRGPRDRRDDRRERPGDRRDRRDERPREPRPATAVAPGGSGAGENLVTLPERPRAMAERFPLAEGSAADAALQSIRLLLDVTGLDLTARVLQGEERLEVELTGADADRCFEEDGEILAALEHLLPRMIRSLCGESLHVRVDCENFHEIREEQLRTLAQRVAADVRRSQRSRTLEPMNPSDRRVVHMTLADDQGVVTESDGDGYFKRVTVRPV